MYPCHTDLLNFLKNIFGMTTLSGGLLLHLFKREKLVTFLFFFSREN